jgi:hypothetical protein
MQDCTGENLTCDLARRVLIEMKYIQYNTQVNECGGSNIADRISPPANTLLLAAMAVKKDLMKNKNGKVVSKKRSALAKENHWHEEEECARQEDWINAVKKARANLKIKGFCAIKKGTPLYSKAREIYLRNLVVIHVLILNSF